MFTARNSDYKKSLYDHMLHNNTNGNIISFIFSRKILLQNYDSEVSAVMSIQGSELY